MPTVNDPQLIKRILDELKEFRQYTHHLTETNTGAIFSTDLSGTILDVNYLLCQMTECSREELIGSSLKKYFIEASDLIHKVLAEGKITNLELILRSPTGKKRVTSVTASLIYSDEKQPKAILFTALDLTNQKYLEEELRAKNKKLQQKNRHVREASQVKSNFFASISHELRTPLNVIIGFTKLLSKGMGGTVTTEQKEYLDEILTNANHLLHLINDILDLSKIESGKMEFHYEVVDIHKLIQEVETTFQAIIIKKNIHLKTEVTSTLNKITLDQAKFKQILYNYISNAIKFTPENGRIFIRIASDNNDTFRLEVEDTGLGISKEDMSRLFFEFQQLESGIKHENPGTGLGLALTRHIVEAQGGKVGVQSIVGKGSIFYAVLPLSPQINLTK